jgi:uncharacterized protein HemX
MKKPSLSPDSLLSTLKSLTSKGESKEKGGGGSTIWKWLGPLLVLLAIATYSYLAFKKSRELAKLRHEKFKREEREKELELFKKLDENNKKVAEAEAELTILDEELRRIEQDIAAEEERHEANLRAIHSIRGWDDSYPRES